MTGDSEQYPFLIRQGGTWYGVDNMDAVLSALVSPSVNEIRPTNEKAEEFLAGALSV